MILRRFFAAAAAAAVAAIAAANRNIIRIGGMFPIVHYNHTTDAEGVQILSAFLLAIADVAEETNHSVEYVITDNGYTFIDNINSCLTVATAFHGAAPHITVGGKRNNVTRNICMGLQDLDILNVVYASDDTSLGNNNNYYGYLRVYPNAALQGYVIADTLGHYYKYERVVVIYSTDDYGLYLYNRFLLRAIDLNINILKTIQITVGQTSDFSYQISSALTYEPRIFIILSSDIKTAAHFIQQAYQEGLLGADSMVWVSDTFIQTELSVIMEYFDSRAQAREILSIIGLFAIAVAQNDWKLTTAGAELISKIRALPPTRSVCNTATDYMGNYIYLRNATECVDVVFSTLTAAQISPYVAYVYDATISAVKLIINYANHTKGSVFDTVDSQKLRHFAVYNHTAETGITGIIEYSGYIEGISNYGMGGRVNGVVYQIYNYYNNTFRRIGQWSEIECFDLCVHTPNDTIIGDCWPIEYGTPGNVIPTDHAADLWIVAPAWMTYFLYILVGIEVCGVLFLSGILCKYRRNRILKISQYPILWIILGSAAGFNCFRIALAAVADTTDLICILRYWAGHANILPIICFFIKTARVYYIVNSKLRRVKIDIYHTLYVIYLLFFVVIVLLIGATAVSTPRKIVTDTVAITGQHTMMSACVTPSIAWDISLYVYEAAILLSALKICNDIKNIPDVINESKYISYIIFLLVGVSAIGFPVVYVFQQYPYMNEFILSLCFFISQMSVFFIYFGYKTKLLLGGMTVNTKMQLVSAAPSILPNLNENTEERAAAAAAMVAAEMADTTVADETKYIDEYFKKTPKTIQEYRKLIDIFQQKIITLNMRADDSSGGGVSSSSAAASAAATRKKPPSSMSCGEGSRTSVYVIEPNTIISQTEHTRDSLSLQRTHSHAR